MKKKMSTNVITHWLERYVSQTYQVENNYNTILYKSEVSEDQIKQLKRNWKVLNLQMLYVIKLKALLI